MPSSSTDEPAIIPSGPDPLYRGSDPSFVSCCPKGSLRGGASGMSVERLGLIVVGMLVLLVLVLFVSTAMVWVAMLLEERGVG